MHNVISEKISAIKKLSLERLKSEQSTPELQAGRERAETVWREEGEPALKELQDIEQQFGASLDEGAEKVDWPALERLGFNARRVREAQEAVRLTRKDLRGAIRQLSQIPGRIRGLKASQERAHIRGVKGSDIVIADMRAVLGMPSELRRRCSWLCGELDRVLRSPRNPVETMTVELPKVPRTAGPESAQTDFDPFQQ